MRRVAGILILLHFSVLLSSCGGGKCYLDDCDRGGIEEYLRTWSECTTRADCLSNTQSPSGFEKWLASFSRISNIFTSFSYSLPDNIQFLLSSYQTGDAAAHSLSFDTDEGSLQTFEAVIRYPKEFGFNGFDAAGGGISQITSSTQPDTHFIIPAINADGTRIAFIDGRDLVGDNADLNSELFLFDAGTNTLTQLTDTTAPQAVTAVSINGDGTRIAFGGRADYTGGNPDLNSEIFVFDTTSATVTQVTSSLTRPNENPSISSDGSRIAFKSQADLTGDNPDGSSEIFLFDAATSTFTQVTDSSNLIGLFGSRAASISADGTRIVFISDADISGGNPDRNYEVFLFDIATATFTQVTSSAGPPGIMLPLMIDADGTRIALASSMDLTGGNPDRNFEIFIFDADSASFRQITDSTGGFNFYPSINMDGARIAFRSNRDFTGGNPDGNAEIFVFDTNADAFTQLTSSAGGVTNVPAIDGDGNRVVFSSTNDLTGGNPDGNTEVFLSSRKIGTLAMDNAFLPEATFALREIDASAAYADAGNDGSFDPSVDPKVSYSQDAEGNHLLTLKMWEVPVHAVGGLFAASFRFTIDRSIFTNPTTSANYGISGTFTSVDPTSGGADDGIDPPPAVLTEEVTVAIVPSPLVCGDADGNGSVNIVDALAIARHTAGLPPPPPVDPAAADVNGDMDVNIVDALMVARSTAGLPTPGTCL